MAAGAVRLAAGRPRKPTSLKRLSGTLRGDRTNASEPQVAPIAMPPPPDGISEDERAAWLELAALVDPLKVGSAADVAAFRLMVQAVGMVATLRRSLKNSGDSPTMVLVTKAGPQVVMRPEVYAIPTYQKLALIHLSRWGLTPADRSRVAALADEGPQANPLREFGLR